MSIIKRICLFILLFMVLSFCKWCDWEKKTIQRLNDDIEKTPISVLDRSIRYVILSDLHRGNGGPLDYFNPNRKIIASQLKKLAEDRKKRTMLILAGDVEEGWSFGHSLAWGKRKVLGIGVVDTNKLINPYYDAQDADPQETIFYWETHFNTQKRYFRIVGNHDDYWSKPDNLKGTLLESNGIDIHPAVGLRFPKDKKISIFITHGSQGHPLHDIGDKFPPLVKEVEMIKYLFSYCFKTVFLEPGKRLREATISRTRDHFKKQEKYLIEWAKNRGVVVIAGHSHLPYAHSASFLPLIEREISEITKYKRKAKDHLQQLLKGDQKAKMKMNNRLKLWNAKNQAEYQKNHRIHLENKDVELAYLRKLHGKLTKQKQAEKKGKTNGPQERFYFNTGHCFGMNMITYINIEYKTEADFAENESNKEGWYIELLQWDVKEKQEISEDDSADEVLKKMKGSPSVLDSYRLR